MKKVDKVLITYSYNTSVSEEIFPYIEEYNQVIRFSYSYYKKQSQLNVQQQNNTKVSLSDIEQFIKNNYIQSGYLKLLDASLIKLAVNDSKNLFKKDKVFFGSRKIFNKLKFKKYSNSDKSKEKFDKIQLREDFKNSRNSSILLRGSSSDTCGNRKAQLDIANNRIIVKLNKDKHIFIILPKLSLKRQQSLLQLEGLCKNNQAYFNLRINRDSVQISFDPIFLQEKPYKVVKNRVLAIDINPNYIGIVVVNKTNDREQHGKIPQEDIVFKEIIDFTDINQLGISNNKKQHEKYHVAKYIVSLARHYNCEAVCVEQFNIKHKDHGKGRLFNRLINNTWHKKKLLNSINKWCYLYQVKLKEINPAYSSYVGCILYEKDYDSIAAACEIANRGQELLAGKQVIVNPKCLNFDLLSTQWKEMIKEDSIKIKTWQELISWIKKGKHSYRLLFNRNRPSWENPVVSSRLFTEKSMLMFNRT